MFAGHVSLVMVRGGSSADGGGTPYWRGYVLGPCGFGERNRAKRYHEQIWLVGGLSPVAVYVQDLMVLAPWVQWGLGSGLCRASVETVQGLAVLSGSLCVSYVGVVGVAG